MTANAFINKTNPPTDAELASALGAAKPIWDELLTVVVQECGATVREWKSYSLKSGWALRARRKERIIIWLAPSQDCFNLLVIRGEAAMAAARKTKLRSACSRLSTKHRSILKAQAYGCG